MVYDRVERNIPYDQIVEGIVTAVSREPNESYIEFCENMTKIANDKTGKLFASRTQMPYFWARNNQQTAEERAISLRTLSAASGFNVPSVTNIRSINGRSKTLTSSSCSLEMLLADKAPYRQKARRPLTELSSNWECPNPPKAINSLARFERSIKTANMTKPFLPRSD